MLKVPSPLFNSVIIFTVLLFLPAETTFSVPSLLLSFKSAAQAGVAAYKLAIVVMHNAIANILEFFFNMKVTILIIILYFVVHFLLKKGFHVFQHYLSIHILLKQLILSIHTLQKKYEYDFSAFSRNLS